VHYKLMIPFSLVRMQAGGPASIYIVAILLGTDHLQLVKSLKVLVVCTGVAVAAYGDFTLYTLGLALQVGSILADALRFCFLQQVCNMAQTLQSAMYAALTLAIQFSWAWQS
jgi:hypothetical protein